MEATTLFSYLIPVIICLIGMLSLALYALRFWEFSSAQLFFLVAFSTLWAILAYLMQLLSPNVDQAWFWTRLRFFGQSFIMPLLFLFTLDFLGRNPLRKPWLVTALIIIPAGTQIVVWNNLWQHLFFDDWAVNRIGGLLIDQIALGGPWFRIYQVYNYALLGLNAFCLLRYLGLSSAIARRQRLVFLMGTLLITLINLIPAILGVRPPFLNTVFVFTVVLAVYGWVIFRYHFFDTFPIAYQMVFLSLKDPVVVLNPRGEVIQMNAMAADLFGGNARQILLQPFDRLLAQYNNSSTLPDAADAQFELRLGERVFDAQLSTLPMANGAITNRVLALRDITRLKGVEAALRESEAMYRLLADNSSDMIVLNAINGQFLYASPACSTHMGYSNSELLSMPLEQLSSLCYSIDWERTAAWFGQLLQGVSIPPLEFRLVRKDGSHFWAEMRTRLIYVNDSITHLSTVVRNIDARHRVEEALRESNRRFYTMAENIPAVVFQYRLTADGIRKFDYVSPTVRKYDGIEPEDAIENPEAMMVDIIPEDRASLRLKLGESAQAFTPLVWEGRLARDGRIEWMRIEAVPTRMDDGAIVWNGVRLDITAQKETEIALARNRNFTERVTSMLPDVLYVFDLDRALPLYFNRNVEDLVGYTAAELNAMGTNIVSELLYPEDFVDLIETQAKLTGLPDGQIEEAEIRIRHKTRGLIWLNLRVVVYERAATGTATQILGVLRDVTERKTADEQRRQLLAQLEGANRSLQDFAYVVSHDLKAPLRGVSSISRWLTTTYGDSFNAEGKELISLLGKRVLRMEQMINGVLEYSRIGREKEKHIPIDLNGLVADIVQDIVPVEQMRVIMENPLPTLTLEPTRLRQVFQNLIDNAVKFMTKPQGEISIGCQQVDEMWMFWIRDNGPGIASQYHDKIFHLFQTLTPKDQFESTGVGLALVKRIIETYGGKIWLESAIDEGTTFYFTVPA